MPSLYSNPYYVSYLVFRVLMSLTTTTLAVAVGWHVYQATGNPFDLAMVALVQVLPTWLLFIVSGWVSDHLSRRLVIQVCLAINAAVFVALSLSMADSHF